MPPVRKADARSEVGLLRLPEGKVIDALERDVIAYQQRVKRGRPRDLAALVRHVIGAWRLVARTARNEVSLAPTHLGIRGEVIPAKPEVQGEVRRELPVILAKGA